MKINITNDEMQPTTMAVIDIGRLCNTKCKHCYYRYQTWDAPQGQKQVWMKSLNQLSEEVYQANDRGCVRIDFTGGEPTIHQDMECIIILCKKLGIKPRIITNGQHSEEKYKNLIELGCKDFLLSIHDLEKGLNDLMQSPKAWDNMLRTMKVITDNGAKFATNTVIMKTNYKKLQDIAKYIASTDSYLHNFINCNPMYEAKADQNKHIQAEVAKSAPFIKKAIDILMINNIWVNVRYYPMCMLKGYEMHVCDHPQVMFDWRNEWDYGVMPKTKEAYIKYAKDNLQKVSNCQDGKCGLCGMLNVCGGLNKGYRQAHGEEEIIPYTEKSDYPYYFRSEWESTDIVVPVYEMNDNVALLLQEIKAKTIAPYNLIIVSRKNSAAMNRNIGLKASNSRFVIQCDDDINQLPYGWNKKLIWKLQYNPDIIAVSARLINVDGSLGANSGNDFDISKEESIVPIIPTACCAFRNNSDQVFDSRFQGSGWEDSVTGDMPVIIKDKDDNIFIKEISELSINKKREKTDFKVLTRNGFKKCNYIYSHKVKKPIIRTITNKGMIKTTDDHSLFTETKQEIKPKELKLGSKIEQININKAILNTIKNPQLEITKDKAWFDGLFLAEGYCDIVTYESKKYYPFTISNKNKKLLQKASKILKKEYGCNNKIVKNKDRDSFIYVLKPYKNKYGFNKTIVKKFRDKFYTKNKFKKVPDHYIVRFKDLQNSFLEGFFEGDGHLEIRGNSERRHYTTKSYIEGLGLQILLNSCKINCNLNVRNDKEAFNLREVKFSKKKDNEVKKLEIISEKYNDYVYDLSTDDGTFICGLGGIVAHNTDFMRNLEVKHEKELGTKGRFVIDNTCMVTHINEEKNNKPWYYYNQSIFKENETKRNNK